MTPAKHQTEAEFRAEIERLIQQARDGADRGAAGRPRKRRDRPGRPRTTGRSSADARSILSRFNVAEFEAIARGADDLGMTLTRFVTTAALHRAEALGHYVHKLPVDPRKR